MPSSESGEYGPRTHRIWGDHLEEQNLDASVVGIVVAVGLILSGLVSSPVSASLAAAHPVAATPANSLLAVPFVYREHSTANHEKVDLEHNRTDAVKDQHNITFSVVERVVSWARSPRCYTS